VHTRTRSRVVGVHLLDDGVCDVRTNEARVQRSGHFQVGHELGVSREERRVLGPEHGVTEHDGDVNVCD
jgi:hypothetical protein